MSLHTLVERIEGEWTLDFSFNDRACVEAVMREKIAGGAYPVDLKIIDQKGRASIFQQADLLRLIAKMNATREAAPCRP